VAAGHRASIGLPGLIPERPVLAGGCTEGWEVVAVAQPCPRRRGWERSSGRLPSTPAEARVVPTLLLASRRSSPALSPATVSPRTFRPSSLVCCPGSVSRATRPSRPGGSLPRVGGHPASLQAAWQDPRRRSGACRPHAANRVPHASRWRSRSNLRMARHRAETATRRSRRSTAHHRPRRRRSRTRHALPPRQRHLGTTRRTRPRPGCAGA
jgi:hypothetical protein